MSRYSLVCTDGKATDSADDEGRRYEPVWPREAGTSGEKRGPGRNIRMRVLPESRLLAALAAALSPRRPLSFPTYSMPPAPLTSAEILRSSWARTTGTRDLRHMLPIPRLERNNLKIARERIKFWNFVSGDKVRVRGHKIKDMLEVTDVNKITNRVRLRVPLAEGEEEKVCSRLNCE